jgi:hypothetical protein
MSSLGGLPLGQYLAIAVLWEANAGRKKKDTKRTRGPPKNNISIHLLINSTGYSILKAFSIIPSY